MSNAGRVHKIALGLPWYQGPDIDCYPEYQELQFYFGKLRERSLWLNALHEKGIGVDSIFKELPPLDVLSVVGDEAEITAEDGIFEFAIANQSRLSLPGLARERIVDMALQWGADWLFWWDYDMKFPLSTFLRLWRHQKPVVNALAFTSRDPILPCLYRIKDSWDAINSCPRYDSETVQEFPDDALISDEQVDGSIAFGAGISLYSMNVFRQIPKPWFNSTGCGEDWFFCVRCHLHQIPRYVDTGITTMHKAHRSLWYTKDAYMQARQSNPELYQRIHDKMEILG